MEFKKYFRNTCQSLFNWPFTQATHINFICPMRFDNFPLDTQTCKFQVRVNDNSHMNLLWTLSFCPGWLLLIWHGQDGVHPDKQGPGIRQDGALCGAGLRGIHFNYFYTNYYFWNLNICTFVQLLFEMNISRLTWWSCLLRIRSWGMESLATSVWPDLKWFLTGEAVRIEKILSTQTIWLLLTSDDLLSATIFTLEEARTGVSVSGTF